MHERNSFDATTVPKHFWRLVWTLLIALLSWNDIISRRWRWKDCTNNKAIRHFFFAIVLLQSICPSIANCGYCFYKWSRGMRNVLSQLASCNTDYHCRWANDATIAIFRHCQLSENDVLLIGNVKRCKLAYFLQHLLSVSLSKYGGIANCMKRMSSCIWSLLTPLSGYLCPLRDGLSQRLKPLLSCAIRSSVHGVIYAPLIVAPFFASHPVTFKVHQFPVIRTTYLITPLPSLI